jgi:hypothetical protein
MDRMTRRWLRVPFEAILIIGMALALAGLAGSILAVSHWGAAHFGPLQQPDTLRSLIPAATLMAVGVQWMFFSFIKGLLGLET